VAGRGGRLGGCTRERAASDEDLHAPRLIASEVANALWRKARLGEIERGGTSAMLAAVQDVPVRWGADDAVCADAVRIALALDHPVYDFVHLELEQRIGAAVVTADLRFANVLAPTEHGEAVVTTHRALRRFGSVASQTTARRSGAQAATR